MGGGKWHIHPQRIYQKISCQRTRSRISEHLHKPQTQLAASEKAMTAPQQDGEPSGGGEQSNENESMELNQNQNLPSEVTLRLWNDVAQGIDKNSTGEESERQSMNTYSIACF